MYTVKSGFLGLLVVLISACQTNNSLQSEDKFAEFERSSLTALQQHLNDELQLQTLPPADAAQNPDSLAVNTIIDAQQLALQHSPRVAAILLELGIHQAETVQKYLLDNPGLELAMMRPEAGGRWKMEVSISLGLVDWLSRHNRQALSESESGVWQMQAWQQLNSELTQVGNQWLQAVAARQKLNSHRELFESANVAADFAQLLFDAGNISELELLGSQSVVAQRRAQEIEAALDADKNSSQLMRMLGLTQLSALSIPDQLPEIAQLQSESVESKTVQLVELAQQHQPALLLLNREILKHRDALALAVQQISLRQSGVELVTERESSGERQQGFALSLAPPVFDNGDTEVSVLQGRLQRTLNQQQQLMEQTKSQIHNALLDINSSLQQIDLLTQDELPRFQRMLALSVQEYNFMLRGTFELLTVADRMLDAELRQIDASEQYWRAWSTLESLVGTQIQESQND